MLAQTAARAFAAERPQGPEIQAVFLLNLTRFVRWPEATFPADDSELVIGVMAGSSMQALIAEVAQDEFVGKHRLAVRNVRTSDDARGCHVLYFSHADDVEVAEIVTTWHGKPVLLVSDADGFLQIGGHVQIYQRGTQFRLRVDLDNLKRAQLAASASLLRVADVVRN